MTKRFEMVITGVDGSFYYLDTVTGERIKSTLELENKLNNLYDENEQLKQQIRNSIEMLQTEKENAITRNERIRLDFAITVLEDLIGDVE